MCKWSYVSKNLQSFKRVLVQIMFKTRLYVEFNNFWEENILR